MLFFIILNPHQYQQCRHPVPPSSHPPLKTTAEILPNQVTSETRPLNKWHLLLCSFRFPLSLLSSISSRSISVFLRSAYFFFLNSWASKSVRWCCEPGCNLATLDLILSGKQGRLVFTSASASLLPYFLPLFNVYKTKQILSFSRKTEAKEFAGGCKHLTEG